MPLGAQLSLVDHTQRLEPDGSVGDVAEVLSQSDPIHRDMVWQEGNTTTGHIFRVRAGLPQGTWRFINQGVQSSKSLVAPARVECGELSALSIVDKTLMDMNKDPAKYRYEEDNAFIQGMGQQMAQQFVYGNALTMPSAFTGIMPYYGTVNVNNANSAANVFNGGGTGANNASILLIGWGLGKVYGVFPRDTSAGLKVEPLDQTQMTPDGNGGLMRSVSTYFVQRAGLCVEDWRYATRIANLDVTSAGLGGNNPFDIFASGLSRAVLRLPQMPDGMSGITAGDLDSPKDDNTVFRPAIYANRTVRAYMDIQAMRDKNVLIGLDDYAGKPVTSFRKIPIMVMDQMTSSEAAIS